MKPLTWTPSKEGHVAQGIRRRFLIEWAYNQWVLMFCLESFWQNAGCRRDHSELVRIANELNNNDISAMKRLVSEWSEEK
jgi:hypothetical protein